MVGSVAPMVMEAGGAHVRCPSQHSYWPQPSFRDGPGSSSKPFLSLRGFKTIKSETTLGTGFLAF